MNTLKHFENENLKDRWTYLGWLLLVIAGFIGFQFLNTILKPKRYSGSPSEWAFTIIFIVIVSGLFLFTKRFVTLTFDHLNKKIILTTTTLIGGEKERAYPFSQITFTTGNKPASLREKSTKSLLIFNKKNKLITLERKYIGEYTFDSIVSEFEAIDRITI